MGEKAGVVVVSLAETVIGISSALVGATVIESLGQQDMLRLRRRKRRWRAAGWDAEGRQEVAVEGQGLDQLSTNP